MKGNGPLIAGPLFRPESEEKHGVMVCRLRPARLQIDRRNRARSSGR
jgi:hypothetical protein